jgi:hypothetical protein
VVGTVGKTVLGENLDLGVNAIDEEHHARLDAAANKPELRVDRLA